MDALPPIYSSSAVASGSGFGHEQPQASDPLSEAVVSVKNLKLPTVIAPNVWNIPKEQPAEVTITLNLSKGLDSAAAKDSLDQNTVHYGELSKRVRKSCVKPPESILDLFAKVENVLSIMSKRDDRTCRLTTAVIELNLIKASMFGEKITVTKTLYYGNQGRTSHSRLLFAAHNMNIMTLIGVNDYERTARQPVVTSASLDVPIGTDGSAASQLTTLFNLERTLVEVIQDSSFETLEALAEFVAVHLQAKLLNDSFSGSRFRLRLEKPKAIAFADAAVIEISKQLSDTQRTTPIGQTEGGSKLASLTVQKPYV